MNKPILLRESVTEAPVKKGKRWLVVVARPGQGSSGKYTAELFERDAQKMVPPGAQAFITHDDARNPKDMLGTYPEGAFWSAERQEVLAELEVFSHWADWVEEVGPHCGISLYAMGELDNDGNVLAFYEDRYNGADLVSRPGLEGAGLAEKLYEAAKRASERTPGVEAAPEQVEKDARMDEKAIAAVEALTAKVTELVDAQKSKAEEAAQHTADDKAVKEAVETYAAKVEAIESARESLLPSQVKHLMAEAKEGRDVAPLIESYKEMVAEAKTTLTESANAGIVVGGVTEVRYGAWS